MVLGVKFETPISPISLTPILFTLLLYHLILFSVHLNSSLTNWKTKKINNAKTEYTPINKTEKKEKYCLNIIETFKSPSDIATDPVQLKKLISSMSNDRGELSDSAQTLERLFEKLKIEFDKSE